jgi:hypothetical protein
MNMAPENVLDSRIICNLFVLESDEFLTSSHHKQKFELGQESLISKKELASIETAYE